MSVEGSISFQNQQVDRATLEEKIARGDYMIIAGDEQVLTGLPTGNWIAGTIPYFMTEQGGQVDQEAFYVTTIDGVSGERMPRLTLYDANSVARIAQEAPQQGFTILILPAGSDVHMQYAQNAPDFPNMFFTPIVGWISGMHLNDLGSRSAKVGFGPASGMLSDHQAAAMHIPLPEDQVATIKTLNLFEPGDGPTITFPENGFQVAQCVIDGEQRNFAAYLKENGIDTRLPLVANYSGVMVNVSVQEVGDDHVKLYAPVFPGVQYKIARPVGDYVSEFEKAISQSEGENIAFSCNCILNFLYSELEGKKTGNMTGPMTFGEVAYQLLNQTMVYMALERV